MKGAKLMSKVIELFKMLCEKVYISLIVTQVMNLIKKKKTPVPLLQTLVSTTTSISNTTTKKVFKINFSFFQWVWETTKNETKRNNLNDKRS